MIIIVTNNNTQRKIIVANVSVIVFNYYNNSFDVYNTHIKIRDKYEINKNIYFS